jgi:putative hydrolase of the HAD superfamily
MKNNDTIKNIIFDFGGVILDIDPQQTNEALQELGFNDVNRFQERDFQTNIMEKFERGILTPESFRNKVREFIQIKVCNQDLDDAWNAMLFDIPEKRIRVLEEVKQNYNIYLLSNSNEIHYDMYLRDLQLRFGYFDFDQLFDKAYFSFDLHLNKPNPEIFEFVMNQHNMRPEQCLFIDDTIEHIEAAKLLGLHTYHLVKPDKVNDLFIDGRIRPDLIQ